MSHFTEVQTKMSDLEILKDTIQSLGLEFEVNEGAAMVRGFYGDQITADIRISTGTKYDIGLRKNNEGSYEFVADWEMLNSHKVDSDNFTQKILQKYSYLNVKKNLSEQGFELEEEAVDENGNIQLVVSRW